LVSYFLWPTHGISIQLISLRLTVN